MINNNNNKLFSSDSLPSESNGDNNNNLTYRPSSGNQKITTNNEHVITSDDIMNVDLHLKHCLYRGIQIQSEFKNLPYLHRMAIKHMIIGLAFLILGIWMSCHATLLSIGNYILLFGMLELQYLQNCSFEHATMINPNLVASQTNAFLLLGLACILMMHHFSVAGLICECLAFFMFASKIPTFEKPNSDLINQTKNLQNVGVFWTLSLELLISLRQLAKRLFDFFINYNGYNQLPINSCSNAILKNVDDYSNTCSCCNHNSDELSTISDMIYDDKLYKSSGQQCNLWVDYINKLNNENMTCASKNESNHDVTLYLSANQSLLTKANSSNGTSRTELSSFNSFDLNNIDNSCYNSKFSDRLPRGYYKRAKSSSSLSLSSNSQDLYKPDRFISKSQIESVKIPIIRNQNSKSYNNQEKLIQALPRQSNRNFINRRDSTSNTTFYDMLQLLRNPSERIKSTISKSNEVNDAQKQIKPNQLNCYRSNKGIADSGVVATDASAVGNIKKDVEECHLV